MKISQQQSRGLDYWGDSATDLQILFDGRSDGMLLPARSSVL